MCQVLITRLFGSGANMRALTHTQRKTQNAKRKTQNALELRIRGARGRDRQQTGQRRLNVARVLTHLGGIRIHTIASS